MELDVDGGNISILNAEKLVGVGVVVKGLRDAVGLGICDKDLPEGFVQDNGDEPSNACGVKPVEKVIEEKDRRCFRLLREELQLREA